MKKILFLLLISFNCLAQIETLTQDRIIDSDTAGTKLFNIGTNNPIQFFNVLTSDLNQQNVGYLTINSNTSVFGNDYINSSSNVVTISQGGLNLNSIYDLNNGYGNQLTLGFNAQFTDFRPIKKGLQYLTNGYVTTPTSLTDKQYVDKHQLRKFTKTTLPPNVQGQIIYVTNATGGQCPAYSDGTNWRRFSDNSIIN